MIRRTPDRPEEQRVPGYPETVVGDAITPAITYGIALGQSPVMGGAVVDIPGRIGSGQQQLDDVSGAGSHLTLYTGRGVTGNGTTDFIQVAANGTDLADITSFSVAFWVTPGTLAAADTYIGRFDTGANKRVWAITATGTTPTTIAVLTSADGGAPNLKTWTSTANHLANGTLIHVCWTYSAGTAVLYVNGAVATGTGDTAATLFATDIALTLFSSLNSAAVANAASATMRDVRFYSVVLTAAEVRQIYERPNDVPQAASLAGRWQLNNSNASALTGYPALDSSGNDRHGTITGCAGATSRTGGPQTGLQSWSRRMWFDGTDDNVLLSSYSTGTTYRFYCKFYLPTVTGLNVRFVHALTSNVSGILLYLDTSQRPVAGHGKAPTTVSTTSTLVAVQNAWNELLFSYSGGNITFTLNGVTEVVAADAPVARTGNLYIGGVSSSFFKGILYDVRIDPTFTGSWVDVLPGTGNQVSEWKTGATIGGTPGNFMVPVTPGSTLDVFGDSATDILADGRLNLFGDAEYGQLPVPTPQSAFTWCEWFYLGGITTSANRSLMDGRDASSDGPHVYVNANAATIIGQLDGGTDSKTNSVSNAWLFMCFTYSGTEIETFVNAVGTGSPGVVTLVGTTTNIRIGNRSYGSQDIPFRGQLAHPVIYNRVLSAQEMTQIYQAERGRFGV